MTKEEQLATEEVMEEPALEVESAEEVKAAEATPTEEELKAAIMAYQEEFENRYKRLQADFDNYKRRTQSEKETIGSFVKGEVLESLLPVLDNFDRALATPVTEENQAFLEGFVMIKDNLKAILEKNGLTKIEALGETFDPNYHNAVMSAPCEEYENDKVCEVFQEGYMVDGRVIRPSMVKVVNN